MHNEQASGTQASPAITAPPSDPGVVPGPPDKASGLELTIALAGTFVLLLISAPLSQLINTWWAPFLTSFAGMVSPGFALAVGLVALSRRQKRRAATMINIFLGWAILYVVAVGWFMHSRR